MLHDSVSFVNRRTLYRYVHWPEVDTRVIAVASFTGATVVLLLQFRHISIQTHYYNQLNL